MAALSIDQLGGGAVVVGWFVLARAPLRRCEWPTMATRPVGPTPLFLTLFWEEVTEIASEAEW